MTPGSPGLMGALLIVIGLAFALLAIAIVLNRRDAEVEARRAEGGGDESELPAGEQAIEESGGSADGPQPDTDIGDEGKESPPPEDQPAPQADVEAAQEPPEAAPPASPPAAPRAPAPRELLPVAELLREEVTGELILRLGDRYLRSPEDIESAADRRKLQYASADLAAWFEGAEPPARRVRTKPRTPAPPRIATPEQAEGAEVPAEPPRPVDMIAAINAILEQKLAAAEGASRAVRLVSDPTGGVRVLIGVKSYPLEEVPDETIKQLIRQAVGEWEASQ